MDAAACEPRGRALTHDACSHRSVLPGFSPDVHGADAEELTGNVQSDQSKVTTASDRQSVRVTIGTDGSMTSSCPTSSRDHPALPGCPHRRSRCRCGGT